IDIPHDAPPGIHRMRVRTVYNTTNFDPCSSYASGETHDYSVNIIAVTCYRPLEVELTDVTKNSVVVNVTPNPLNAPTVNYAYEVRESGAPGSGITGLAASGVATTNPFTVTGLQPLTKYTVYVSTRCSASDLRPWRQAEDDSNTMCDYPELIIAPDVTVCGSQEVDLTAIFDSGTVFWYDSVTQDSLLHTGANFKTPFLTSNTSYWVQAGDAPNSGGGPKANVGPIDNTIGATGNYTAMNHWMLFTVNSSTTIYIVDVFANGSGLVDVLIQ